MPYLIYANIESLIKKIDGRANNPENSSTSKIGEHIPRGYSSLTIWVFHRIDNKHTLYRGKNCMKKFCEFLREHAKIKLILNRKKHHRWQRRTKITSSANVSSICGKRILQKLTKN